MIAVKRYLYALIFSLTLLSSLVFAPLQAFADPAPPGPNDNGNGGTTTTTPTDQSNCDSSSNALCGQCNSAKYGTDNSTANGGKNTNKGSCITDTSDPAATTCDKNNCDLIAKYLNPVINIIAGLVGIVAVISLIMGGIQFSSSAGDPQKAAAARGRIGKTIGSLLFFFFLYAFLQFLVPGGIFNQ